MAGSLLPFGQFIGSLRRETRSGDFCFAEVLDRKDEEVPKHTHEDAHFLLVVQGVYLTSAHNIEPVCPSPSLIYNPAGTTHRDRFQTRGGRFFTVSIKPATLQPLNGCLDLLEHPIGFAHGGILRIGTQLYREMQTRDELSPLVMEGMALELLAYTLRREIKPEKAPPRWLQTASELLRDRCCEAVTVREIAQTLGVHPFHLARTFRTFFHCSPSEYLRQRRIEHATVRLRTSHASLAEVALECGFSDQSQFTKTCKRLTGHTPGEYRKLYS
jgi:AraC family transcriptional regulator